MYEDDVERIYNRCDDHLHAHDVKYSIKLLACVGVREGSSVSFGGVGYSKGLAWIFRRNAARLILAGLLLRRR